MLYYRDFLIIPGEDQAFVLSALWRALHAHQRATGAQLVSVPVKHDRRARQVMLAEKGQLADGFRVFAQDQKALEIALDPYVEDAVQAKQSKIEEPSDTHCIVVRRVYVLEERKRRKKGQIFINPEWTQYFWHKKDNGLFRYYIYVKQDNKKCAFISQNTFGCGCVPVKLQ
ncbi:MAG TPA: hypothetical protein EYH46_03305 [Sulfurivirga caldicuralii]|nr:hypothetical protein [Sulfurivirga caldicuralii]